MSTIKTFMLSMVSVAACWLMAAPNPALVPETADMVITVDGLNVSDKASDKIWQEELKKLGFDVDSTDPMQSLEEACPGLSEPIALLLGYSKEAQTITARSVTAFVDLLPKLNKDKEPEGSIVVFIEQPNADLAALQKAIEAFLEKQEEKPFTVVRKGAWLQFKPAEEDDNDDFFGICEGKGGYMIALAETETLAETYRKGDYTAIAKTHPLQKAFGQAADNQQVAHVMVYKLAKMFKTYMEEEDFEALKMQVPFAAQVDNLLFKAENTGDRGSVTIVIDFATVETAQEVAEMLIGYKAMATGMLLPMAMGTPDSKTAAFVKKIRIASNEKQVTLSLAGSRDEVLGILKELQEVQQRQQAALKTKAADQEIVIDGLDKLFDEEDDDVMTPEEAESILDSID